MEPFKPALLAGQEYCILKYAEEAQVDVAAQLLGAGKCDPHEHSLGWWREAARPWVSSPQWPPACPCGHLEFVVRGTSFMGNNGLLAPHLPFRASCLAWVSFDQQPMTLS